MKYLAFHDNFTGLYNRNWYDLHKSRIKKKHSYFIDINNLKAANTISYETGDNLILQVVKHIEQRIGKNDVFVRYGGDEFIVLSNQRSLLRTCLLYKVTSLS